MAGVLGTPPAPRSAPEAGAGRLRTGWWPGGPLIPASRTADDSEHRADGREGATVPAFLPGPVASGLR